MKDTHSHITMVTDRSGSMASVRSDAEGAVNYFFDEQKKVEGTCSVLFVDFDTDQPFNIVHDGPLADVRKYTLTPRGSTPLLDAVGLAIVRTGEKLSAMPEDERPAKVIFVVQTDGLENASREYTWDRIRDMIKEQTDNYQWEFVFLGMGLDTFKQGGQMGISNTTRSAQTADAYASTYANVSRTTAAFRGGTMDHMQYASANTVNVDAAGKTFDQDGNEIDPKTGKIIGTGKANFKS